MSIYKNFQKTVFEGSTDNAGNANIQLNLNANDDIRQIINAVFKTTVFEPEATLVYYSTVYSHPIKPYIINIPKILGTNRQLKKGKASNYSIYCP